MRSAAAGRQVTACRTLPVLLLVVLMLTCAGLPSAGAAPVGGTPTAASPDPHIPVYAYFYQWFSRTSWDRAKADFPVVGKYSSDDPRILRTQLSEARTAGIDGFLTSWKSTPTLNRRLQLLIKMAHPAGLDVGVVYEALDFQRKPLPIATVRRDLTLLINRWGPSLRSSYFGKPVIIWTGTNDFSRGDIQSVRNVLGDRAILLAASKNVADYRAIADLVDGEAYYWSSADPNSAFTKTKLEDFGKAVHANHQIWIAPAASGFDGRTLGQTRVIPRDGGQTLIRGLDNAYRSKPDAVGVISWNEWSENTYIEPGERYGTQEMRALRTYLGSHVAAPRRANAHQSGSWSGLKGLAALAIITFLGALVLTWYITHVQSARARRRRSRDGRRPPRPGNAADDDSPSQPPSHRAERLMAVGGSGRRAR